MNLRPAIDADMGFVFDYWLLSFRKSPHVGPIPQEKYFATYRSAIQIALGREGVRLLIAEHNGVLMAFAAGKPPDVLCYVYVKPQYRGMHVPQLLLTALGLDLSQRIRCAYWTKDWKVCIRREGWRAEYVPEVVRYPAKKDPGNGAYLSK